MTKNIDREIEGVEFKPKDPQAWAEVSRKSSAATGFALAGFTFAVRWARLMQARTAEGTPLRVVAEQAYQDADYETVSDSMSKLAEDFLVENWAYGDSLRKWVLVRELLIRVSSEDVIDRVCNDLVLFYAIAELSKKFHEREKLVKTLMKIIKDLSDAETEK